MKNSETRITVPTGLRLFRPTDPTEIHALLRMFSDIAAEEGWRPGEYLQTCPPGAIHIALECDGEIVGGLQAVLPDRAGKLPCHNVWPEAVLPTASAHVTIIAVKQSHRGRIELFWALCQDLWCFCADSNTHSIALEATPKMHVLYRRMGLPLQIIGELREHWGEPCYLTSVSTLEVAGSIVMKARRSEVFRRLVLDALQADTPSGIVKEPRVALYAS